MKNLDLTEESLKRSFKSFKDLKEKLHEITVETNLLGENNKDQKKKELLEKKKSMEQDLKSMSQSFCDTLYLMIPKMKLNKEGFLEIENETKLFPENSFFHKIKILEDERDKLNSQINEPKSNKAELTRKRDELDKQIRESSKVFFFMVKEILEVIDMDEKERQILLKHISNDEKVFSSALSNK